MALQRELHSRGRRFRVGVLLPGMPRRSAENKTTRRGINWPMSISRNGVERSRELAEHYQLYRVYNFSKPQPGLYQLKGALADTCDLDPQSYAGLPKVA